MEHISFWLVLMRRADNIDATNKNTDTLTDANKEVGLEINVEKSKYMLWSHHQNAGQTWNIKITDRLFAKKSVIIQIFENDSYKSKYDSGGN
jgi:hypothetical protein